MGALANRVSEPLAGELTALSSQSYGPGGGEWNGRALAKALRSFAILSEEEQGSADVLPPLMPTARAR